MGIVLELCKKIPEPVFSLGCNFLNQVKKLPEVGCFVDAASGAVTHVPNSCVSNQNDVDSRRFQSVLSCEYGRRRSGKVRRRPRQWHVQGRFSMSRVWLSKSSPIIVQSSRRNNSTQRMGSTELSRRKKVPFVPLPWPTGLPALAMYTKRTFFGQG